MKKMILPSTISVIILLIAMCAYTQNYDLIVTTKGDSIACRIDSITVNHVYYNMKSHGTWIHTQISRSDVSEYKQDAIHRNKYEFKPGTTIIASNSPGSLYGVRKNSVYVGILSVNYARMVPLSKTTGLTLGGGLINIDGWGVVGESSVLLGGVKHFFETGIMGAYFFAPNQEPDNPESGDVFSAVTIRIGYRYQAQSGLLLRLAPNIIFSTKDSFVFPALSIGYSFY